MGQKQAGRTEGIPWSRRETFASPSQVSGNFRPYAEPLSPVNLIEQPRDRQGLA